MTDASDGTREARRRYDGMARKLGGGRPHPTLGFHPDRSEADWWQAGAARFDNMVEMHAITPRDRVIDYGCGTLRLGGHFIRFLDRGNYFGLDVADDFLAMGKELVGADLIADRAPLLATIGEHSLAAAETFGASILFSEAVDYHVVPDELKYYYRALLRLAHRPGSRLLLSVRLADDEREYIRGCWARPVTHFQERLSPLIYVTSHDLKAGFRKGCDSGVTRATLEFKRA